MHLALWTAAPEHLLTQSRYAALLVSRHGTILYGRSDLDAMAPERAEPIRAFLAHGREVQAALIADLGISEADVERNGKLVFAWDWLSLGLCLGWDEGDTPVVPLAEGDGRVHFTPTDDGRDPRSVAVRRARARRALRGQAAGGPLRGRGGAARRARPVAAGAPDVPAHTNGRPGIPGSSPPVSQRMDAGADVGERPVVAVPARRRRATASSGTCSRVWSVCGAAGSQPWSAVSTSRSLAGSSRASHVADGRVDHLQRPWKPSTSLRWP